MKPDLVLVLGNGELRVEVFVHDIHTNEVFECSTYVSDGLAACGQAEIVLTIKIDSKTEPETVRRVVAGFYETVFAQARERRTVHVGDVTTFVGMDFLGCAGILYARAQPLHRVRYNADHLAVILLTKKEVEAVNAFGHLRVLARLGAEYRYYPFPTWADLSRRALPMDAILRTSMLGRMSRLRLADSACTKTRNRVTLHLPTSAHPVVKDALIHGTSRGPVAILTGLHPLADACLVWDPSFGGPMDIRLTGSKSECTSGCFVSIGRGLDENFGRLVEDGFAFGFTNEKWAEVESALRQMQPVVVSLDEQDGELELELKWVPV